MTEKTTSLHCSGCGIAIQTDDPQQLGYAPKVACARDVVVCRRCYRLTHYNEMQPVQMSDDDFSELFQTLYDKHALIVKVIDVFDVHGSWITGLQRFVGRNQVLLVANKVDLLPKSTNRGKVRHWLKKMAADFGLKPVDVLLMSAETGENVEDVCAHIDTYRRGRDVYVVGCTNVGKSSFINDILSRSAKDAHPPLVTTSHFPGTTLQFIEIPLEDERMLVDTPGLINRHQMAHLLSPESLKAVTPKKELKPRVYQLQEEQTLFLGGLARLDFKKGAPASFIVYAANSVPIHRTKLSNADALFEQHIGTLLSPPTPQETLPALERHVFRLQAGRVDVVYAGLGWVTVQSDGVAIEAYAPAGIGVSVRMSMHA
ncbi:ribosome biogenesis GTPase YqeH [Bacillus sp. FSL W7-1360]